MVATIIFKYFIMVRSLKIEYYRQKLLFYANTGRDIALPLRIGFVIKIVKH